jgi:hypothetical protein
MTDISITNTFSAGTKAKSAEVNENFADVEEFLNTTGVHKFQATKIQAKRAAWTPTDNELTVTWDTPFADANYTVSALLEDSNDDHDPILLKSKTATQVVIRTVSQSISSGDGTIVHLIGIHD